MTPAVAITLAASLLLTLALTGLALTAAAVAAFPQGTRATPADRASLYVGSVVLLAMLGTMWSGLAGGAL